MIPVEAAQAAAVARALAPLKQLTRWLPDIPRRNRTPDVPDAPHVEPRHLDPPEVPDLPDGGSGAVFDDAGRLS
jgi:hypothetical protein